MKVLKFGAEWCGPCRTLDQKLENFTECEVVKYDVSDDENEELVEKYNIRNIPVTLLVNDDTVLEKWVGVFELTELSNAIKKYNELNN